ncbi:MAG: hypothetical protein D6718_04485 [Acidobacteria bacterium]|nr:MAG: hypothetical protein D6718_04485 [Acidobacteriota bacterium]
MRALSGWIALGIGLCAAPALAGALEARPPAPAEGQRFALLRVEGKALGELPRAFERRTFWDLRPLAARGTLFSGRFLSAREAGLGETAAAVGADGALCFFRRGPKGDERRVGCLLFDRSGTAPEGPRWLWSDLPEPAPLGLLPASPGMTAPAATAVGARELWEAGGQRFVRSGVAEGVVVVPGGPAEAVLVREEVRGAEEGPRLRLRFVDRRGGTVALLEGPLPAAGEPFRPRLADMLAGGGTDSNDGIEIGYESLSGALRPKTVGVFQRAVVSDTPLTSLNPAWTSAGEMISIDQFGVDYQPDPGDPGSATTLPEVWDFTGLVEANLTHRRFLTTRDDIDGPAPDCPETCAVRDLGPNPPDGTWQAYLKADYYTPTGGYLTRDIFTLNDNDTGANPSIDIPYLSQDEMNTEDWTQVCYEQSAGGPDRLFRFLRFSGPDPATATMKVGDTWTSGNWTECDDAHGLKLTTASQCDPLCWPGCNGNDPRARGLLPGNAGFRMTVVEDGWVHVPQGNYVPSLLMRQDTELEAGIDFLFGVCNLGTSRQHSYDYYWLHERYGLLARVSAPTDPDAMITPDDWSHTGNVADNAEFTWGPFPPKQTEALACLSGTLVRWSLPDNGANLTGEPGVTDYGYVVSWGTDPDPERLADWNTNPNHTPLPGEPGYLAAPPGNEPTEHVITGWPGGPIHVTVTTALRYTDPDYGDTTAYRSAAFYKVVEDPATLDPATFRVGPDVAPFVSRSGPDIVLDWPPVAGADHYLVRVWDLSTRSEIPCPAGMDCNPPTPHTVHPGAAEDGKHYGYRAYAVDPCGEVSAD